MAGEDLHWFPRNVVLDSTSSSTRVSPLHQFKLDSRYEVVGAERLHEVGNSNDDNPSDRAANTELAYG